MTQQTAAVQPASNGTAAAKPATVKNLLMQESIKKRFEEILKDRADAFISSLINVVNANKKLQEAEPQSVILAAAMAATMDLPINQNLGFAWIVPYDQSVNVGGKWVKKTVAQFQLGWKGYVQLAVRTGLYQTIGVTEIRKGQLKKYNALTSEYDFDFTVGQTDEVIGYAAYFRLISGFEKVVYWNVGKVHEHAKAYSKAFQYDLKENKKSSVWSTNFDSQGKKTLVKNILSQWGIMSIEMHRALKADQAVILDEKNDVFEYADSTDVTDQEKLPETNTTEVQPSTANTASTTEENQSATKNDLPELNELL